jgi:deazaflavin-dependent oxidoreductase (nitroreductase family)
MPKVPAISAWLNRTMNGRSAPAPILRLHRRVYLASRGRLGHGIFGVPCLVLSTTGRRTGKMRHVALVYVRDGDSYVLAASNDGQDHDPAWLLNIHSAPVVALLVKSLRVTGMAKILGPADPGYSRLWAAFNAASGDRYQHYQAKTSRPIPVVVIEPDPPSRPHEGSASHPPT